MEQFLSLLGDWHFAASVVFVGGFLGPWIFRKIPVPADAAAHMERFAQAHAATGIAHEAGIQDVEDVAKMASVVAGLGVISALRRQSRQAIIAGLVLSVVICAVAFLTLPLSTGPSWLFLVAAAFGLFRLWKAW
jgi:hypothetical protein